MDLRSLRYFVEIVEQGSMKRAAASLFIAQPALSQQMRKLEEELDVKLLNRSVRGVVATEAGRELLQHARLILESVHDAEQAVQAQTRNPHGKVVLGLPASISAVLSVPLILRLQAEMPKISLRVVEGISGYVLDWLRSGVLDVCVLHDMQKAPGIVTEPLFSEDLYLVEGTARGSRARSVRFADLAKLDLILPGRHSGLRDMLDRIAHERGVRLQPKFEIDAFTQLKALARAGVGSTVLSRASIYEEIARGELHVKRVVAPRVRRHMYLARNSEHAQSNAARATVAVLKQCVADFDGRFWDATALTRAARI